jgi:hypothetical protein
VSSAIVHSLAGNLQFTFSLVDKFLENCPEDIWKENFGGWPVWQQLYHAFAAVDFFLRPKDAPAEDQPCDADVSGLKRVARETPDRGDIRDFIVRNQARVALYAGSLDDESLTRTSEGPSARMGREMSHAAVLALLGAHTMYHLGACDAALRQHGLPGVF